MTRSTIVIAALAVATFGVATPAVASSDNSVTDTTTADPSFAPVARVDIDASVDGLPDLEGTMTPDEAVASYEMPAMVVADDTLIRHVSIRVNHAPQVSADPAEYWLSSLAATELSPEQILDRFETTLVGLDENLTIERTQTEVDGGTNDRLSATPDDRDAARYAVEVWTLSDLPDGTVLVSVQVVTRVARDAPVPSYAAECVDPVVELAEDAGWDFVGWSWVDGVAISAEEDPEYSHGGAAWTAPDDVDVEEAIDVIIDNRGEPDDTTTSGPFQHGETITELTYPDGERWIFNDAPDELSISWEGCQP